MEAKSVISTHSPSAPEPQSAREEQLRESARDFEAAFISAMLKESGFEEALSSGSGLGGEAMSGLLIDLYAEQLAGKGGFRLQEAIYNAIARSDHE